NTVRVHLSFDSAKTVTFDPILVTFAGTVLRPTNAQVGAVLAKLNQLYPSQVLLGTTRSITLDQNLDDGDMLDEIQDRFGCGDWGIACGYDERRFEVGLLPSPYPGAPGLSNRGNGAFWAKAADTVAVAHEMGHAIGFEHAGCSHGEDSGGGCDSFFPIPNGGIGGYGFDFTAWNLIPPGGPSTPVADAHDLMP